MDFPIREICYASSIFWIAGSLQGLTGFGFNLLSIPAMVLWFPAQVVVPGVLMSYLPLGTGQFIQLRRDVDWKVLGMIVGSAIVGMPLGAFVLRDTDAEVMKRAIGLAMVVLAIVLQLRPGNPFRHDALTCLGVGAFSGFLSSSIGVSGTAYRSIWAETALASDDDACNAFDLFFVYFHVESGGVVGSGGVDA